MTRNAANGSRPVGRIRRILPTGRTLPQDVWAQRHEGILVLLWLHVPALFAMTIARGETVVHGLLEAGAIAVLASIATLSRPHPGLSMVTASVGLMTCSAELVHLSGGLIEMHFHFFVMVGVVTLYQDWRPFLVSIGYVLVHHGVVGINDPAAVYNHAAAIESPWRWAGVHAGFILTMSAVGIVSWRLNEALISAVTERQEQLTEAQAIAKLGSWEYRRGIGTIWSEEMYHLLGSWDVDPTDMDAVAALLHPDDRQAWRDDVARATRPGSRPHALDLRVLRPDGVVVWLHSRGEVREFDGDEVVSFTGTVQDITDRKQAEAAMRASNAERRDALSRLEATLESTADGILAVDAAGRITAHNRRFASQWEIDEEVLDAGEASRVLAHLRCQLRDGTDFVDSADELFAPTTLDSPEVPGTVVLRDGRVFECVSLPQRVDGEVTGRVWSFRDVTDRTRLEDELAHQAFHDALTGLANQALFRDRLDHAIARIANHSRRSDPGAHGGSSAALVAVLFVDLDNFKNVNDSLGHAAGDELLKAVTDRLLDQLRPGDTAARLGGDEFAVLLEDLDGPDQAEAIAARLRDALAGYLHVAETDVFTTASIGVAVYEPGATGEQLLRDADLAMYTAKRLGKDRIERFAPAMHDEAMDRIELEGDLRRAIAADELCLHYQPVVDLATGEVAGVEALVRWVHPRRGLLGPDAFIPFAEESGLIEEIGLWVLEHACAETERWHTQFPHRRIGVSVNLSLRQLRTPQVVSAVADTLDAVGLDPRHLTLEITETATMHDTELALSRLHELKALGVRLAVDDFGTGYSSLNYLQQFPIDVIKIDRAFVERVDKGVEEAALARAIVRLAQTLDLATVAEGVENVAQIDWLREVGCDGAQGYYLSRPLEPRHVSRILESPGPLSPVQRLTTTSN